MQMLHKLGQVLLQASQDGGCTVAKGKTRLRFFYFSKCAQKRVITVCARSVVSTRLR